MRSVDRSAVVVAAIAIAPVVAVALPFGSALRVQCAVITALLALRLLSRVRPAIRALGATPRPVLAGMLLYGVAALWGAAVGFGSSNSASHVIGQSVSMLLLPIGFIAFTAPPRLTPRALLQGLGLALGLAILVHLAAVAAPGALGPPEGEAFRLILRNDIGFAAPALLVVVLGTAWLRGGGGRPALIAVALAAVILVGAMSRGAWFAAAVGLVTALALTGRARRSSLRWTLLSLCGVAVAAVVIMSLATRTAREIVVLPAGSEMPTAAVLPPTLADLLAPPPDQAKGGPAGRAVEIARDLPLHVYGVELDATLRGDGGTEAILVLEPAGREAALPQVRLGCAGGDRACRLRAMHRLPAGTQRLSVYLWTAGGTWNVEELRLRELPSPAAMWSRAIAVRLSSLRPALSSPRDDGTLAYRLDEWRAIRAQWSQAGLGRLLAGQGLGARFTFPNASWDNEGRRIMAPTSSYIHNFYVFLAFKLGLAGLVALGGLLLVICWTASKALALRRRHGAGTTWFPGAAAAAWLAFLTWSLTSPEILDFRLAAIWGALIAASCEAADDLPATTPAAPG